MKALKRASYKYDVFSETPYGKYKTVIYASNRRELRKRIESWLDYELNKNNINTQVG